MITVISPSEFKTVPWKNGQGETTELLMNETGDVQSFDWRISIASVAVDGFFSDFSGYHRTLVLIEGEGISLQHDNDKPEVLTKKLELSSFSGSCKTYGQLLNGAIKDFNIITNNETIAPQVRCYKERQQVVIKLTQTTICFAYSLTDEIEIDTFEPENRRVPVGHLVKLSAQNSNQLTITLTGKNMIVVRLEKSH